MHARAAKDGHESARLILHRFQSIISILFSDFARKCIPTGIQDMLEIDQVDSSEVNLKAIHVGNVCAEEARLNDLDTSWVVKLVPTKQKYLQNCQFRVEESRKRF